MLTDKPCFICTGNVLCCQWRFGDVRQRQRLRLMFMITQYNIAVGIGELNGQPFRIDTAQRPGWRSLVSGPRHHRATRCICRFRGSPCGIRSTERWHTAPTQSPLTTLEFYHRIAGEAFYHAQRMIRQEIPLETLLLVSIKPVKSGWLSAKYRSSVRYDGPLLGSVILSHGQIHCVPSSTVLPGNMVVGNVANHHLHRDTTRQQNRTVIFSHI